MKRVEAAFFWNTFTAAICASGEELRKPLRLLSPAWGIEIGGRDGGHRDCWIRERRRRAESRAIGEGTGARSELAKAKEEISTEATEIVGFASGRGDRSSGATGEGDGGRSYDVATELGRPAKTEARGRLVISAK
ncbi:hypothetical protein TIFTF001_048449 [Ficus carica]|uniref:Uncharacterized protein n=1 Tax=Ficus carica TaxID=3494 RepID=A0AA87ZK38_FICCA|nr:hypothetical protein TIFTF001_048446 [Ficus carica]GMN35357.1 hypothetical protein TIFTF001_048447 [Ficus carica]GMN35374.1 hypothetical protein TIFTF001_048448 [Ficus carica]GMN35391.1 hypothetical protein TIFTF001_048449 [Ficus carica]